MTLVQVHVFLHHPHPLLLRDNRRRAQSSVKGHMAYICVRACVCVRQRGEGCGSRCQKGGWFKFNCNRADICMAGPVFPSPSLSHTLQSRRQSSTCQTTWIAQRPGEDGGTSRLVSGRREAQRTFMLRITPRLAERAEGTASGTAEAQQHSRYER